MFINRFREQNQLNKYVSLFVEIRYDKNMDKTQRDKLATYMKALGHPVRVQIIEILGREGQCISGDLTCQLPVAASTASQHLSILKDAGLISGTIDGPRRCYCTNKAALDEARSLLDGLSACC